MIALLSALPDEIKKIVSEVSVSSTISHGEYVASVGTWLDSHVVVASVGVGKALAAAYTQWIIDRFAPRAVFFAGLGGALADDLALRDVVVASECVYHDLDVRALGFQRGAIPYTAYRFIATDLELREIALAAPMLDCTIRCGRVLTGDQFITNRDSPDAAYLREELQGDVVEMEGASIALVSAQNRVPCLILRTVSDRADGSATLSFVEALTGASENAYLILRYVMCQLNGT